MSWDHDLVLLLSGCFAILLVSTAVAHVLRLKLAAGPQTEMVANLIARINAWWVMIGLLALAVLVGKPGVILLFAGISFLALREFITLTHTRRADHWGLVATFFVLTPIQYGLIWAGQYGIFTILIPVYGFLFLPILSALRSDTTDFFERIAKVQWGLMICVYCISYVPALLTLKIDNYEGRNILLAAFLIAVVQLSDVLQYVWVSCSASVASRHRSRPPKPGRALPAVSSVRH
jgi:phosphatidate cytidylyltransferase